jgi:seipin
MVDLAELYFIVRSLVFTDLKRWIRSGVSLESIHSFAWTSFKRLFQIVGFAVLSIAIYAFWYYKFVPVISVERPLYFDFRQPAPTANVYFVGASSPILSSGQPYDVFIDVQVPESEANRQLGMLMLSIRMFDRKDRKLFESARSVRLRYTSTVLKYMRMAAFAAFYAFGWFEEQQHITVRMLEGFVPGTEEDAISRLQIELSDARFEVYTANVHFEANVSGLPYIVQHHFYSSSVLILSFLFAGQVLLFFAVIGSRLSIRLLTASFHAVMDAHLRYLTTRRSMRGREQSSMDHLSSPASSVDADELHEDRGLHSPLVPESETASVTESASPSPQPFPLHAESPFLSAPDSALPSDAETSDTEAEYARLRRRRPSAH